MAEQTLSVTSRQFADGGVLPMSAVHTSAGGENRSPQLAWSPGPAGTRSYALTCHDPDAPTGVGFSHWVRFNLPASVLELPEAVGAEPGIDGLNDFGERGYDGPAPPPGPPHRYVFTVYALDVDALEAGERTTYALLRFLVREHVLASGTLTGTFGR
ncbi:MAG TPA: YbhB/YbcL family Raf kinase inhibitor-like protein [Acidimicrobiales bacterium]|jgi:Raf kinase inhibitor-like YbhB/YbcL family protein|nr:YbhB/YbcL family Raf kinase inhibitor-like protein [Acidimicrobiales bacterium]